MTYAVKIDNLVVAATDILLRKIFNKINYLLIIKLCKPYIFITIFDADLVSGTEFN